MSDLRKKLIKLAYENPAIRPHLLPLLKKTASGKWMEIIEWASDPANMKKPATPQAIAHLKNLAKGFSGAISFYVYEHRRLLKVVEVEYRKFEYLDTSVDEQYLPPGTNDPQRGLTRKTDVEVRVPVSANARMEIKIPMPECYKILWEYLDDIGVKFDPQILYGLIKANPKVLFDLLDDVSDIHQAQELREYAEIRIGNEVLKDYHQEVESEDYDVDVTAQVKDSDPFAAELWYTNNGVNVGIVYLVKIGVSVE